MTHIFNFEEPGPDDFMTDEEFDEWYPNFEEILKAMREEFERNPPPAILISDIGRAFDD